MFGLILYAPAGDTELRQRAAALAERLEIPLSGFTDAAARFSPADDSRAAFLAAAVNTLLTPGSAIPADAFLAQLSGDAYPGNLIRKYVFLQLSLLPYLRPGRSIMAIEGGHLLGDHLLAAHVGPEGEMDCRLPDGDWCELYTGEVHSGRFRRLRSLGEPPLFVRANTLLPIGVNDRTADACDADRLTLHWYQPGNEAVCTLQSGERYAASYVDGHYSASSDASLPWHLIVHRDGMEAMIR